MADRGWKTLELVVYRLRDGVTREELVATIDPVSEWAAEQPGFISRDVVYSRTDDQWIDVIWWQSLTDAEKAAAAAETSPRSAPMFALIDMDAVVMLHGEPIDRGAARAR